MDEGEKVYLCRVRERLAELEEEFGRGKRTPKGVGAAWDSGAI